MFSLNVILRIATDATLNIGQKFTIYPMNGKSRKFSLYKPETLHGNQGIKDGSFKSSQRLSRFENAK